MLDLSLRLKTIITLVPNGARVCDIGTDHGYLSIYLKQSGIAKSVIASDIRPDPLASAKNNIQKFNVSGIELRLGNGLQTVKPNEVDTVIIAGMGGEVIAEILNSCDWVKCDDYAIIMQPTTSAEVLRKFLCETGFKVEAEIPVEENGKLYSVMKCRFNGKAIKRKDFEYYIGEIMPTSVSGKNYLIKQQKRAFSCMEALKNIPKKQKEFEFYKSIYIGISERLER